MALHENLKKIREERKLTKKEVCESTGISERAYLTYEFGEREPKISVIEKLADFYGVTTDYLLGREPAPNPFADLNLSEDDEAEVIAKYMSLSPEIRACMLDVLVQLGDAAKKRQADSVQSTAQSQITKNEDSKPEIGVTYSKIHTDEGSVIIRETPAGLPKISEFFDD